MIEIMVSFKDGRIIGNHQRINRPCQNTYHACVDVKSNHRKATSNIDAPPRLEIQLGPFPRIRRWGGLDAVFGFVGPAVHGYVRWEGGEGGVNLTF